MGDSGFPACRAWIASRLAGESRVRPPGTDDARVVAVADEEGVTALLAVALEEDDAAAEHRRSLDPALRKLGLRELAQQAQARLALGLLADAGIPALVLKGSALAYWLYPDPLQRPGSDLDLLVATNGDAQHASNALAGAGYALVAGVGVDEVAGYETALRRDSPSGSHVIDLHWRLLNNAVLSHGLDFDELWAHSIPIPQLHPSARGLGRVHALVHALLHRVTNMPSGRQDRLVWLYDIHLLAGGCDGDDWAFFLQVCRDKRIATPCLDGLEACAKAFATAIPAGVDAELRSLSSGESWKLVGLDQGAMDRAHLAALPLQEKFGWLRRKLLPSPEFMRHRYEVRGGFGLLRAYVARWWTGIRRGLGG
jgi:hypothetical protein